MLGGASRVRQAASAASVAVQRRSLTTEIVEKTAKNLAESIQSGIPASTNKNVRDQSYKEAVRQMRRLYIVETAGAKQAKQASDELRKAALTLSQEKRAAAVAAQRAEKQALHDAERARQAEIKAKVTQERAARREQREKETLELQTLNLRRLSKMSEDFITRENIDEYLRTALVRRASYNRGMRTLMPTINTMEQYYQSERVARDNRRAGKSVTAEALRQARETVEKEEAGTIPDIDAPGDRIAPPPVNPPRSSHFFFVDRNVPTLDRNPYEDPLLPWAPGYGSEVEIAGTEHELAGTGFNKAQLAQRRASARDDDSDYSDDDLPTTKKKQPNKGSKKNKAKGKGK